MPLMQLLYRTQVSASSPSGSFASWSEGNRFDRHVDRISYAGSHAGTGEDVKIQRSMTQITTSDPFTTESVAGLRQTTSDEPESRGTDLRPDKICDRKRGLSIGL
jgi:hypothetical protein